MDIQKKIDENIFIMLKYDKWEENECKRLSSYIIAHKKKTNAIVGRWFIKHFEVWYDMLLYWLENINYQDKKHRPYHRFVQWITLKNNMPTLFSAFRLLTDWFYSDAFTMIRSLYESIFRIFFLSYYPESREATLYKPSNGWKKFNLTNFERDDLWVDWWYSFLSLKGHSNSAQTIEEIVDIAKNWQTGLITMELWWDVNVFSQVMNRINFVLRNYLYFLKEFFYEKQSKEHKELTDVEQWFFSLFQSLSINIPTNAFFKRCKEAIEIYDRMKQVEIR